ncbi:MAG: MmgE/PrpD family protein, partial [Pseudomonadota bacterium]
MTPQDYIHALSWDDLPPEVRVQAEMCLLDLIGVGLGGATTRLSHIIRDHASRQFGGPLPMLFDGRGTSALGFALAGGMTIDALDGHDGYNPAKGHVGCGLLPALLALAQVAEIEGGHEILTSMVMGYELGARLGPALHATAPDYHTSGAWIAVAAAAVGARLLRLDHAQTAHALGIAEYHGPRSQMMRCIDHPTMVKDGSGWGAMAGVSAALLAQDGFTGAPALTLGDPPEVWSDLGQTWLIRKQYFKPYPVCRWAQAPVEAALALCEAHHLTGADIARIEIESFHEATRLATATPRSTEEAQYSTSYPVAVALARGAVTATDIGDNALSDNEILRLSLATEMREHPEANAQFPARRLARVTLVTHADQRMESDWTEPKWDATAPPTEAEVRAKFHGLADPIIGPARAQRLEGAVSGLATDGLAPLLTELAQPISSAIWHPRPSCRITTLWRMWSR